MLFTGHSEHTIDAKSRIAIPARHRNRLDRERDGLGWYCVAAKNGSLRLYTEKQFEEMASQRTRTLTPDEATARFDRVFYGMTEQLDMDDKGRIPLPRRLMERAGLTPGASIMLVGVGERLEIWPSAAWLADVERYDEETGEEAGARDGAKRKEAND